MHARRTTIALVAAVATAILCAAAHAGPSLLVTKPPVAPAVSYTGPLADPHATQGQWFQILATGLEEARSAEFYDNIANAGGGAQGQAAISGFVANIIKDPFTANILQFEVIATVRNDTMSSGTLWMPGNNSHGESLQSGEPYQGILYKTRLTASFAIASLNNLPAAWQFPYVDRQPYIVAANHDSTAWYCWTPGNPDILKTPKGGYFVPAWNFGSIRPGTGVTRVLKFVVPPPGLPSADPRYPVIVASQQEQQDILLNRTTSLKISDWIDTVQADTGIAYPESPLKSSDVSVFHNTHQLTGSLTFSLASVIPAHFWYPTPDPYNEMLNLKVEAGPEENVQWDWIEFTASGSGIDDVDISSVSVWLDEDGDGTVDPTVDTLIGSGAYLADNGTAHVNISLPGGYVTAGGSVTVLVCYTMSAPATGSTFVCTASTAQATGEDSLTFVTISGLPLSSQRKIAAPKPISIGQAKHIVPGTPVLLEDKEVTANFISSMALFYMEEKDPGTLRSSGIGVVCAPAAPIDVHVGDRVSVMGTRMIVNGSELVIPPDAVLLNLAEPHLRPVAMTNRDTGGKVFGFQPGVMDQATPLTVPVPSYALNNVGLLLKTWGTVMGTGYVQLSWPVAMNVPVFWINDGTGLHDGYFFVDQKLAVGLPVVMPTEMEAPKVGSYYAVTGVLRAISNPAGQVVRLLEPRSWAECQQMWP